MAGVIPTMSGRSWSPGTENLSCAFGEPPTAYGIPKSIKPPRRRSQTPLPSLKGLGAERNAYPALKGWATLFRPAFAGLGRYCPRGLPVIWISVPAN